MKKYQKECQMGVVDTEAMHETLIIQKRSDNVSRKILYFDTLDFRFPAFFEEQQMFKMIYCSKSNKYKKIMKKSSNHLFISVPNQLFLWVYYCCSDSSNFNGSYREGNL